MAPEGKKQAEAGAKAGAKKSGNDRRRLGYLRIRFKEVREEMLAIKNETAELKKKLGAASKGGGGKKSDDDED
jgi:hypothetical protein